MVNGGVVQAAFLAGSIAAGATVVGTLPALFARSLSPRVQDTMLGFGAGIMLAEARFSLVLPALGTAQRLGAEPWNSGLLVGLSLLVGAGLVVWLERGKQGSEPPFLRHSWKVPL